MSQDGVGYKPGKYQYHGMHTRFLLGGVGGSSVQATGNGIRRNFSGEKEVVGKLRRVRSDGHAIFPQTAHAKPAHTLRPPDEGGL